MVAFSQSLQVYACKDVNIVVDTRRMTHKQTPEGLVGTGSVLHPHSNWDKGHQVYMFLEDRCVCSFVVPLLPTGSVTGGVMEGIPLCFDGIEYEPVEPKLDDAAIPERKRSKRGEAV